MAASEESERRRCFVGGLAGATEEGALERALSGCGEILESKVIRDRLTGKSRGFGFVTFSHEQSMRDAIERMNGLNLDGRLITVNQAHSTASRGGGSRNGRRGGGGYSGDRRSGGGGSSGGYGGVNFEWRRMTGNEVHSSGSGVRGSRRGGGGGGYGGGAGYSEGRRSSGGGRGFGGSNGGLYVGGGSRGSRSGRGGGGGGRGRGRAYRGGSSNSRSWEASMSYWQRLHEMSLDAQELENERFFSRSLMEEIFPLKQKSSYNADRSMLAPSSENKKKMTSSSKKKKKFSAKNKEKATSGEKRDWAQLPVDVLTLIFQKLGSQQVLSTVQAVCSLWKRVAQEPQLWRCLDFRDPWRLLYSKYNMKQMVICAIDRSQGELVEFSIEEFGSDDIIKHVAERTKLLRCLRLKSCDDISDDALIEALQRFALLEELEISYCSLSEPVLESAGRLCLRLKHLKLDYFRSGHPDIDEHDEEAFASACDEVAAIIAKHMPNLQHLQLLGNQITKNGLQLILDGCPHLRSLDLRECFNLVLEGKLLKTCRERIKDLKLPHDPTDDFGFWGGLNRGWMASDEDYPCAFMESDDEDYSFDYLEEDDCFDDFGNFYTLRWQQYRGLL